MKTIDHIEPVLVTLTSPFKKGGYGWKTKLHAQAIALGIRIALKLGYVVILIGVCRSGKSYILERAVSGRVLNRSKEAIMASQLGYRRNLYNSEIPQRYFAIDEFEALDPTFAAPALDYLSDRPFAIALQRRETLKEFGSSKAIDCRKRLEITLKR